MKLNSLALLFGIPLIAACKSPSVKYLVNDGYTGPVVVFVTALDGNKRDDTVLVRDGLGIIDESNMHNLSNILSIETSKVLNVVSIGDEVKIDNESRNVFCLGQSVSSSNCLGEEIKSIRFFVGTKVDYERWSVKYVDELWYFDSMRIDWCGYYQRHSRQ